MSLTNIIIGLTVVISFLALNNHQLRNQLIDHPYTILRKKEYYRLLTSGFIHADYIHLLFNMFVLYSFGNNLERILQINLGANANLYYLGIYIVGIIFSSIPAQIRHRNNPAYMSLGASGGVSSVLFAVILLFPTSKLQIFPIPIDIPAWFFGFAYVGYSLYMDKRQSDNVNHMAHMWGALWGVLFAAFLFPSAVTDFLPKVLGGMGI